MSTCDLCGRACLTPTTYPYWWPHTTCDRRRCRQARHDAIDEVYNARAWQFDQLAASIMHRQTVDGDAA